MNTQKEIKKAIKHAGKYMKKEQDRLLMNAEFTKNRKLINYVARKIERRLSFTNGWSIDRESYTAICMKLATEIIKKVL